MYLVREHNGCLTLSTLKPEKDLEMGIWNTPSTHGNMWMTVLMLRKGKDRPVNDCGIGDILSFPNRKTKGKDGKNIHDSEKPVSLFATLIKQSSNEGDLILDPFMGSGTTAIACRRTNRHFIGFEIDENYYKIINNRLVNEASQLDLFNNF